MREPISEPVEESVEESLGKSFDPLGAHLADPYPFYARSRRDEPIFYSAVFRAWMVSRFADVRQVMRDGEVYSSANTLRPLVELHPAAFGVLAQGYPPIKTFIEQDGEPHRRWRVPTADRFTPEEVDLVEPFIRERANALVDAFIDDGHADFMPQYADRLPVEVISHMLGIEGSDDIDTLRRGSFAGGSLFNLRLSEEEQVQAAADFVAFQHLIARYVRMRRAEPGDDVISKVVAALVPGDGPLTFEHESDLVPNLLGVGLAGNITTTGLLGNAVRWLLEHPEQWRILCERPELIPGAVEEAGRFDPPTHGFFRVTTKDVSLAGKDLPAGTEIFALFASANRDESVFERADEFDITRPSHGRTMTFGHGAHFCLGSNLARREATVTLEVLSSRIPGLRLVPEQEYSFRPTIDHRGLLSLRLEW